MIWPVLGEGEPLSDGFTFNLQVFFTLLIGKVFICPYNRDHKIFRFHFSLAALPFRFQATAGHASCPLRVGMLSVWRVDVSLAACYILGMSNGSSTLLGQTINITYHFPKLVRFQNFASGIALLAFFTPLFVGMSTLF